MTCKNCGYQINEGYIFCQGCGEKVEQNNGEVVSNTGEQNRINESINNQPVQNQQASPIHQEFGVFNQQPEQHIPQQPIGQVQQPMQQPIGQVQQPIYQQPAPQQPAPQQQMYNNQQYDGYNPAMQQKNKMIPIIIGAVAVVVIALLGILIGKYMNNEDNEGGLLKGNDNGYKVNFKGFDFNVPTNLIYEVNTSNLNLTNQEGTWMAAIEVVEGTNFSQMVANKANIQPSFNNLGFTTKNLIEKTYSGVNFITFEATKGGVNYIIGITEANSMNLFGLTSATEKNDFDYNVVKTVASILKSAKYTGESANIKTNEFNLNSILDNMVTE